MNIFAYVCFLALMSNVVWSSPVRLKRAESDPSEVRGSDDDDDDDPPSKRPCPLPPKLPPGNERISSCRMQINELSNVLFGQKKNQFIELKREGCTDADEKVNLAQYFLIGVACEPMVKGKITNGDPLVIFHASFDQNKLGKIYTQEGRKHVVYPDADVDDIAEYEKLLAESEVMPDVPKKRGRPKSKRDFQPANAAVINEMNSIRFEDPYFVVSTPTDEYWKPVVHVTTMPQETRGSSSATSYISKHFWEPSYYEKDREQIMKDRLNSLFGYFLVRIPLSKSTCFMGDRELIKGLSYTDKSKKPLSFVHISDEVMSIITKYTEDFVFLSNSDTPQVGKCATMFEMKGKAKKFIKLDVSELTTPSSISRCPQTHIPNTFALNFKKTPMSPHSKNKCDGEDFLPIVSQGDAPEPTPEVESDDDSETPPQLDPVLDDAEMADMDISFIDNPFGLSPVQDETMDEKKMAPSHFKVLRTTRARDFQSYSTLLQRSVDDIKSLAEKMEIPVAAVERQYSDLIDRLTDPNNFDDDRFTKFFPDSGSNAQSKMKNLLDHSAILSGVELRNLTRIILTLPAGTAEVERAFSVLFHIRNQRRSRLTDEHLDTLLRIRLNGEDTYNSQMMSTTSEWMVAGHIFSDSPDKRDVSLLYKFKKHLESTKKAILTNADLPARFDPRVERSRSKDEDITDDDINEDPDDPIALIAEKPGTLFSDAGRPHAQDVLRTYSIPKKIRFKAMNRPPNP